jgi:predicted FMN-binding regulatory protein PaiB
VINAEKGHQNQTRLVRMEHVQERGQGGFTKRTVHSFREHDLVARRRPAKGYLKGSVRARITHTHVITWPTQNARFPLETNRAGVSRFVRFELRVTRTNGSTKWFSQDAEKAGRVGVVHVLMEP